MTFDERLCRGFEELGLPIEPGLDTSTEAEYVAYSYARSGTLWGDDGPCLEQRRWSVVYAAPAACDRLETRQKIMQMIFSIFSVWPREDDVTDAAGQRWLYEFGTVGGIDVGTA